MALKILLADDSMTAQNMGKKILLDGGYEVVTVSNGAAAVKKIAEQKPDLVILDVYMPGYTGLEVCERVKNAVETGKTPVLLTVGKMEPFKAEDGHRVRADGLLIKPFEASDLLAVVKKLTEKSHAAEVPEYEKTVKLERPLAEFSDTSYEQWKSTAAAAEEVAPKKLNVPQEMAVVPAMGADILEAHEAPPEPMKEAEPETQPRPQAAMSAAAAGDSAFSVEPAAAGFALPPELVAAAEAMGEVEKPVPVESSAPPSAEPEVEFTAAPAAAVESVAEAQFEPTAAPQAPDVTAEPLPDLEPTTLQDDIPVQVAPDAALVTEPEELAQFTTKFGVENAEEIPVGIADEAVKELSAAVAERETASEEVAAAAPATEPEPAPTTEQIVTQIEQELQRAIGEVPVEVAAEPQPPAIAPEPQPTEEAEAVEVASYEAAAAEAAPPEPTFEAAPVEEVTPVEPAAEALPGTPAVEEPSAAAVELEPFGEEITPGVGEVVSPSPEESEPEEPVSAEEARSEMVSELAATHGLEEDVVAEIVGRVMDRLKPELIAEITKRLKER